MSFLTPLTSLEVKLNSSENDRVFSPDFKKLPKWLLEFETFSIKDKKDNKSNERPLTESSVSKRPQWFKELIQRRRLSDTFTNINLNSESKNLSENSTENNILNDNNDHDHNDTTIISPKKEKKSVRSAMVHSQEKHQINYNSGSLISLPLFVIENNGNCNGDCNESKNLDIDESDDVTDSFDTITNIKYNIDFIIPELPNGQKLLFEIKTNWGDDHFIGLNGIEIFHTKEDSTLEIQKIWSEPDPNTNLSALTDGIYRTHDDAHIWLAKYSNDSLSPNIIGMQFAAPISIILIRIWNYNKSRIYSYRGVKLIHIKLDDKFIFKGEIAKSSGDLCGPPESFGDTILFTTDEELLENVSKRDLTFQELLNDRHEI